MHAFSPDAFERPYHALHAVCLLREHGEGISRASRDARSDDEMVVAVVEPDLTFGGAWIITRQHLIEHLPLLEGAGGWSFTFAPQSTVAQVERRCFQLIRVVYERLEAMERRAERHPREQ
jgi:7-keto-8-aminopelargonate synthetase-like enzyme